MRFYDIRITNPKTGALILPANLSQGGAATPSLSGIGLPNPNSGPGQRLPISSLLPSGQFNPSALGIEFDIPVANFHTPAGGAFLRIWGLGLAAIGNAFNLNDMNIAISGGMSKGLPLANPAQQGLLMSGKIFQAYGNWIGTDQSIDMNFQPDLTPEKNFSFTWLKGTPLSTAIAQTLSTAVPDLPQVISISPNLVLNHDEWGYYESAQQFQDFINGISKATLAGTRSITNYQGVQISTEGAKIRVWDGTQPAQGAVKEIAFQDMLGQPTWSQPNEIIFKVVLRGDLYVFQTIKLPPSLFTTTAQSYLRFQDNSAFTGNFTIQNIHHYGNFRQPDAASWNTTVTAVPEQSGSAASPGQTVAT